MTRTNFGKNVHQNGSGSGARFQSGFHAAPSAVGSIASRATMASNRTTGAEKYLGYADLPNQVHRRAIKKGFAFNLMILGESGSGKSTFINSFFTTDIYNKQNPGPSERFHIDHKVDVHTENLIMTESGVKLRLAIIDVPGYGDLIDNTNAWCPVAEYIDEQYYKYLSAEMSLDRDPNHHDTRVHCLLYFISPKGTGLKALDIDTMKNLHEKVNIVPVIGKADTLTEDECFKFKETILKQINEHGIRVSGGGKYPRV